MRSRYVLGFECREISQSVMASPDETSGQFANIIEDMQQRFRDMHRKYFDGLIDQVERMSKGRTSTRSVHEYIEMRRGTIGVYPSIALVEYLGLSSPSHDCRC